MKMKNQEALYDNLSKIGEVTQICAPLLNYFDLTFFSFIRIYPQGSMVRLSNHAPWTHFYFSQELYNDIAFYKSHYEKVLPFEKRAYLWNAQKEERIYQHFQHHGLWNGLSFYIKEADYLESWSIATHVERNINNLYIEKREMLENFFYYFKHKAFHMIEDCCAKKRISLSQDHYHILTPCTSFETEKLRHFIKKTQY